MVNPLITKAIETKGPQNTRTSELLYKDKGNSLSPSKTTMTAGIVRIVRKFPSSPHTSGIATLTKKACAAGVKSITLNEMGWKLQSDIRTFRTAIVFCLKGRMGRSHINRVKEGERERHEAHRTALP
ncbi:hypothetical protein AVEN_57951-1 [Araneus ventricosus]|uniref:Uncharacterized protein n=1 Tax=Araneus ventricosus TaxID=182803 RepID=A0A4Y2JE74_ARAVE|nr:hypothetical protein AVEN_57951-1 [Araneus ventricosus]